MQHENDTHNETLVTVHEHSPEIMQAMIDFMYLGQAKINSNDLVDLLGLS